jgi:erythronate-4-phosphate dehydrogenase|uniref:4-phosphoerythronate dehydrogenase n=1 Tax=candidate division WOR-3 bacterium TaxID=2052148 RepID=A0A7V3RIH4_UNCW3
MHKLKIVADEKIPFLDKLFYRIGEIKTLPSSEIKKENIKDFDILMVRTVTKVDAQLLENTRVKIVCTMASGIDHIDRIYLKKNNIRFIYAPGSNARAVAEYVIVSLLLLAKIKNISLNNKTVGVIGVGNVGKKVARFCSALGMNVLLNDPPKFNRFKNIKYLSLKNLSDADIITLHVPLTFSGKYKTYHMADENFFSSLKNGTIFINTSRGSVVDERALLTYHKKLLGIVLDVWENEPSINIELLKITDIGTPHIAGYSIDGKFNASFIVYKKLCKLLGIKPSINKSEVFPRTIIEKDISIRNDIFQTLYEIILQIYNPLNDHNELIKITKIGTSARREYFEMLRKNYPFRREFTNYLLRVNTLDSHFKKYEEIFKSLGFKIKNRG